MKSLECHECDIFNNVVEEYIGLYDEEPGMRCEPPKAKECTIYLCEWSLEVQLLIAEEVKKSAAHSYAPVLTRLMKNPLINALELRSSPAKERIWTLLSILVSVIADIIKHGK